MLNRHGHLVSACGASCGAFCGVSCGGVSFDDASYDVSCDGACPLQACSRHLKNSSNRHHLHSLVGACDVGVLRVYVYCHVYGGDDDVYRRHRLMS